jgi:hypothetical protein
VSERNECTEVVCGFLNCWTNLYTGLNLPYTIMNCVHLRAWYGASSGCWRRRRPSLSMEVSCDSCSHIELVAVDSRQLAILHSIYLEIPSNFCLNTVGNNDTALTFLLVPAERIRHITICVQLYNISPNILNANRRKNCFVIFVVESVVIRDISIQYLPFNTHKNETDVNIQTHKCWKPSG